MSNIKEIKEKLAESLSVYAMKITDDAKGENENWQIYARQRATFLVDAANALREQPNAVE